MFHCWCCVAADRNAAVVETADGIQKATKEAMKEAEETLSMPVEDRRWIPEPGVEEVVVFSAVLKRSHLDAPWGFKADFADEKTIYVCEVREGSSPVEVYNWLAPGARRIRTGDYVVAVNGVNSASVSADDTEVPLVADALREAMRSLTVELQVVRPHLFTCKIPRHGQNLGLDLNFSHKSNSLVIVKVYEGAVLKHVPQVRSGDRILGVDGVEGSPEALLKQIRASSDEVTLRLSRVPNLDQPEFWTSPPLEPHPEALVDSDDEQSEQQPSCPEQA